MRDATRGHWTTFNDLMTLSDEIVGRPRYSGEDEARMRVLFPWAKDREDDPIALTTAMRPLQSVGTDKVFLVLKVDRHPDAYRTALLVAKSMFEHGFPGHGQALEAIQKGLDGEDSPTLGNAKNDPSNIILSAFNSVRAMMAQDRTGKYDWEAEKEWQLREFINIFGAVPATDWTMKRIAAWNGTPLTGKLDRAILADAFSEVQKQDCKVKILVTSESTRSKLIHTLDLDVGANALWGAHLETGDVPDNQIFCIGEHDNPRYISRIDLTE